MGVESRLFMIYQLIVFSEANKLGLINKEVYKDMIQKILDKMLDIMKENITNGQ